MIYAMPRRTFLGMSMVAGAAGAATIAPGLALAEAPPIAGIDARLSEGDRRIVSSRALPSPIELQTEIVAAWRAQLRQEVTTARALDAYTRWDLALVLAGLAREDGFKVEQHQLSSSLFLTRIASA